MLHIPESWNTLEVLYEEPRVERLWQQLGENRVYIHRIHPCYKPLYHPHSWPSAVHILAGKYRMQVGYETIPTIPPSPTLTVILSEGSFYEMVDPAGWHSVEPLAGPSLSIMLTGKPWFKTTVTAEQRATNRPLTDEVKAGLLQDARVYLTWTSNHYL